MKRVLTLCALFIALMLPVWTACATSQWDIQGPTGSKEFGQSVTVLPNGNFVVIDISFEAPGAVTGAGAAYLFSADGQLISSLTGGTIDDNIGSGGVQVLANGNFVVRSPLWDNGTVTDAGAVTWGSASSGFIGGPSVVVSSANSLVGSHNYDTAGVAPVAILNNGNYVVRCSEWDNAAAEVGAVTWGNGATGVTGVISAGNSLVGSSASDYVGSAITVLPNGNYVVSSISWSGASAFVGAVTWCNGSNGFPFGESNPGAVVSSANSLVGSSVNDVIGSNGVMALINGNYVVSSPLWDNPAGPVVDAGAVTWCDGSQGRAGAVASANSLVGSSSNDAVGSLGVTGLTNGNYVVRSDNWTNLTVAAIYAGAATWCDGSNGIPANESSVGVAVSDTNSLVGMRAGDAVSSGAVIALTNGNYVVCSPDWDNLTPVISNVGAATWANGNSGVTGAISVANSLIGSSGGDHVASQGGVALTNGNYVIRSRNWINAGAIGAGAATWGNGATGVKGVVSAANSLIGTKAGDNVSGEGVIALSNGNYVVISSFWDPPASLLEDFGAVTWGSGVNGVKGVVSVANSLVGGSHRDMVGNYGVVALSNGNYVVNSPNWDNPAVPAGDAGAVTWGNGVSGAKGVVAGANSLVGGSAGDLIGSSGITALTNGNYVVSSSNWDNTTTSASDAGAVTWGSGSIGVKGLVSSSNSLVGVTDNDAVGTEVTAQTDGSYVALSSHWSYVANALTSSGAVTLGNGSVGTVGPVVTANSVLGSINGAGNLVFAYDRANEQLIVGQLNANKVTRMSNLLRTIAKTGIAAPGGLDISFGTQGSAAVNEEGQVLADFLLVGPGSEGGRNKGLFGTPVFGGPIDLVMQLGDNVSNLGSGLPADAKATGFTGHVTHQVGRGLFLATLGGTGLSASNNSALLYDNGASVSLVRRTGQLVKGLGNPSTFREVVQSLDHDLLILSYQLKSSTTSPVVGSASDTGLLPLTHGGSIINANLSAHEGQPAFGGGGVFGEFIGRAVGGQDSTIHFAAGFKNGATSVAALFRMTEDGVTTARTAKVGDPAPGAIPATFASFPALSQTRERALFKATLSGGPTAQNEGLWREGNASFLVRKGVTEVLSGVKVASIIRFWPARSDQVVFHATLSGTGVTVANNEALVLLQNDGAFLVLLRKGDSPPGIGAAKILAISAVDVNPTSGTYVVLTTLGGSPSDANQALWTGATSFGNDTTKQFRRLPLLRLRKGDHYSTSSTALGLVKSIMLKPAADATGAGGRGLAQAIGRWGTVAIYIVGAGGQVELVVLPAIIFPA